MSHALLLIFKEEGISALYSGFAIKNNNRYNSLNTVHLF